ncbi:reverse transcriptase domain-containing protein [Tanacetum coccineum]
MSDSEDSTVTYTTVSSPFGGMSEIGSPGVDGLPVMPEDPYAYVVAAFQAPKSPDYVPGPEYPPSPDFVPEPVYPEFMPLEDEVLPTEELPLPAALSPTADSPGYVPESNPEEDLEEDDDEDLEEDPADYPADGGDDGDDDDESSDDNEDEDVDIEGDEEEEEEHPAPADSTAVALPVVDQAPSAEETKPFEIDESAATPPPHPAYRVARLLAIPTPRPSPLCPWSSPLPQIPSPPLPPILSLPLPVSSPPPPSPIRSLGYRAAMIWLRAEAPSTSYLPLPHIILSHTRADTPSSSTPPSGTPPLLPIPLPTSSPPLHLLSTDRRADRPEVTLPPRKRLCIAPGPRYEVGESSYAPTARPPRGIRMDYGFVAIMNREIMRDLERDVSYGIIDTWDEMPVDMLGAPTTNDTEVGRQMTEFTTRVRQDTNEIYMRLDDEQSERQLMAGRLNMLYRDRHAHARTVRLIEAEARMRQAMITELLAADRRRQAQFIEALELLKRLQTQMTEFERCYIWNGASDADRNTNGVDSHILGAGVRRTKRTTHECTYTDFLKCQPLNFKGMEGVAGLSQWFERMESVFHISNFNYDAAYGMPWKTLMKMMTDKYCPRNEIKKLEMEIWDLKMKGTDLTSYTQCFQDLALLCERMFPKESDKNEKYVGGLPDMIHGSVVASKPKTMQDVVEIATDMDKKIRTFTERQTESKKKFEDTSRNTHNQ